LGFIGGHTKKNKKYERREKKREREKERERERENPILCIKVKRG